MNCDVKLTWDDDIWVAVSENEKFGLVLEAESCDVLISRVKEAIYDIMEVDYNYTGEIELRFEFERIDRMVLVNVNG